MNNVNRINSQINLDVHEKQYRNLVPEELAKDIREYSKYLNGLSNMNSGWRGLYHDSLQHRLQGKMVLELGSGNGVNALIMASYGAKVVAVDIAPSSACLINKTAKLLSLTTQLQTATCDILDLQLPSERFDFIVGKGFLHHLTHEQEEHCLKQCAMWLKGTGEARFFENAENNILIDYLRWYIPLPGRPSCLNKNAFNAYRQLNLSHPIRVNSSEHFVEIGKRYFEQVTIIPGGGLERFHRLLVPGSKTEKAFLQLAGKLEESLPHAIHLRIARGQTVILNRPLSKMETV